MMRDLDLEYCQAVRHLAALPEDVRPIRPWTVTITGQDGTTQIYNRNNNVYRFSPVFAEAQVEVTRGNIVAWDRAADGSESVNIEFTFGDHGNTEHVRGLGANAVIVDEVDEATRRDLIRGIGSNVNFIAVDEAVDFSEDMYRLVSNEALGRIFQNQRPPETPANPANEIEIQQSSETAPTVSGWNPINPADWESTSGTARDILEQLLNVPMTTSWRDDIVEHGIFHDPPETPPPAGRREVFDIGLIESTLEALHTSSLIAPSDSSLTPEQRDRLGQLNSRVENSVQPLLFSGESPNSLREQYDAMMETYMRGFGIPAHLLTPILPSQLPFLINPDVGVPHDADRTDPPDHTNGPPAGRSTSADTRDSEPGTTGH